MTEEIFGEPNYEDLSPDLKLFGDEKWTIWEKREYEQTKTQTEEEFLGDCNKIAWFDNILQFHLVWKKIPHSKPSDVLFDATTNSFKIYADED